MYLKFLFWWTTAIRFSKVFFRATKEIQLVSLETHKNGATKTIVQFSFKNAIWAQMLGGNKTIKNEIALIGNESSLAGKTLIVQGFFHQKSYPLSAFELVPLKLRPF